MGCDMRNFIFLTLLLLLMSGCSIQSKGSISEETKPRKIEKVVIIDNKKRKPIIPDPIPTEELEVYNGPVEHIFFHPLVIYPEMAFDGDFMSQGYKDWFITVKEFNKIIESLYKNNYILIKMSDLFDVQDMNGKTILEKKELKLPKNKKPLVLSVDDLNYYQYMRENGNAYKLIIDNEGEIATYSKDLKGVESISREHEIVPILESFIKKHPDFSFHGARGILALTGYEGILGYQTHELTKSSYPQEKDAALMVVNKLKQEGWEFASHGYGHLNTRTISLELLRSDTASWKREVEPLIGKTSIFIYPYGSSVLPEDKKFKALQDEEFSIFCSVGPNPYLKSNAQFAMMDRVHIDGVAFEQQKDILARFFNSDEIIDSLRYQ
jgi:hypothetical protein